MSEWKAFEVAVADGIAEITLIGPGKGNAQGPDFWRELPDLVAEIDADPQIRVAIVSGSGKNFSYGLDLAAMAADFGPVLAPGALAKQRTAFHKLIKDMQSGITAIAQSRVPVIAAVHGWCIGGGVDLITAADIRYASADAKFSVREARAGMVADMGSLQRLGSIIGEGHLRELAFTAADIDAARAERIGLVNEVVADHEAVLELARATARTIADNPPLVIQGVKDVLNHQHVGEVDEGLRYVAAWNAAFLPSKDITEAITAVFEKRAPRFSGE
ncbi:crotonase/enoyl-CoA hydratase family protein [Gordonia jinhuaensis]|nr:crotonase/enoyl-CoA hydratase family protein [Gordonia jinhuaensis]